MKKAIQIAIVFLVFGHLSGCGGDSFASLFHETMAIYNELADNMLFVCDESTAEEFSTKKMEKMTKRWGDLNARVEAYLKRTDAESNPKIKFEIANLFIEYSGEYLAVQNRIQEQVKRCDDLRYKIYLDRYPKYKEPQFQGMLKVADLGVECPKLTTAMAAPNSFSLKQLLPENPFEKSESIGMPGGPGGMPGGMPGGPGGMPGGMPGGPGGMPGGPGGMPRP
jgi:hypothetical protein